MMPQAVVARVERPVAEHYIVDQRDGGRKGIRAGKHCQQKCGCAGGERELCAGVSHDDPQVDRAGALEGHREHVADHGGVIAQRNVVGRFAEDNAHLPGSLGELPARVEEGRHASRAISTATGNMGVTNRSRKAPVSSENSARSSMCTARMSSRSPAPSKSPFPKRSA